MTLAGRLADFTAGLAFETLPPAVVADVGLRMLDVLGVALAASTQDFAPAIRRAVESDAGLGGCTVLGSDLTVSPPLAILANGALAHGLDFDDTHSASITHASAVILPTVLALGEQAGHPGRRVVTAAVAGYEAIARLGMAGQGRFHARGWHATSVCGTLAAALAAGKSRDLDGGRLTAALGIAGSFASGLMEFLEDGSWVKRLHPGWAGQAGAMAATLAGSGCPGPATVLEGRFGVYRTFLGVDPDPGPFATLGSEWETLRIAFKPYPCCHYLHAFLDCAVELRRAHGLEPAAIDAVECRVPEAELPVIGEPLAVKRRPRTPYDARFSLPFSVAAALLDGRVTIETYTEERLEDPAVLALADRVVPVADPTSTFPAGFPGWVRVRLHDGRELEARAPDGRGGPGRPLPAAAIIEKFHENTAGLLPATRRAEVQAAATRLGDLADVRELMKLCRL
jgi:2-methylcitrate dehydratase PrpD